MSDNKNPQSQNTYDQAQGSSQDSLDKDIYKTEAQLAQLNEFKELREAARPLVEYLRSKYDPHTKAIVSGNRIELFHESKGVNV